MATSFHVTQIARVCHEANRQFAFATGEDATKVHPSWDDAPDEIRQSAITGVQKAQAGETPRQLHESWCEGKLAAGWSFGPVRDNTAKIHPCLVDYDELPAVQKVKDSLFLAIVNAMAPVDLPAPAAPVDEPAPTPAGSL